MGATILLWPPFLQQEDAIFGSAVFPVLTGSPVTSWQDQPSLPVHLWPAYTEAAISGGVVPHLFSRCFEIGLLLILNTSYPRTHPLIGSPFPLEQELVIDMNIYVHVRNLRVTG